MMTPMNSRSTGARDSMGGFTLIEVLVAVLVISVGMLGVARLVLAAITANDSAYFRTQAANLAYSILDQMRANRAAASTAPGYTVAYTTYSSAGAAAPYDCLGTGNICSPTEMTQYNLYEWQQQLGTALPSGQGEIVMGYPAGSGQVSATITVKWDDSLAHWAFGGAKTANPNYQTFTLESAL